MNTIIHNHNVPINLTEVPPMKEKAKTYRLACLRHLDPQTKKPYTWNARTQHPKECPGCKSRYWNVPK